MILSSKTIREHGDMMIDPFCERTLQRGMSYGISYVGYDVRIDLKIRANTTDEGRRTTMMPGIGNGFIIEPGDWLLAGTIERFVMPCDIVGFLHPKSTWTRQGLMVPHLVLEPGWCGHLGITITNQGKEDLSVIHGDPIAQVVFHLLDDGAGAGYSGKYQDQGPGGQGPRFEDA